MKINNNRINKQLGVELQLEENFGECELDQLQFLGEKINNNASTMYSDRMFNWDSNKFNRCCKKCFGNTGQWFNNRSKKDIDRFLSMYLEKEVNTFLIVCYENRSNGFPYWRFDYCTV